MHKRLTWLIAPVVAVSFFNGCDAPAMNGPAPQPKAVAAGPLAPVAQHAPAAQPAAKPAIVRGRLQFIEGYRAGMQAAAMQRKPALLFFTATWCHFCHQLAAEAFTDAAVVRLSERFVCVLVDADCEPDICRHFRVQSYPTIQFISARGQPLNRMIGKRSGYEVARQMNAALEALARSDTDGKKPL